MDEVLLPIAADPTIAFSVSFRTGSQNDPGGKEGLAQLTGAMLAEAATRTRSYDEILQALYPLAASYEISVDREVTALTGRVHKDKLDTFTELFAAALCEPAFEADDFERIRSDTENFLANTLRYSSDEELAKAVLYAQVFAGTSYAHSEAGTIEGLRAITLDDVRNFYAAHYTQSNATLALAGGFDPGLVDHLRDALKRLPSGQPPEPPAIVTSEITHNRLVVVDKPGADASISLGFPLAVHRGESDFYALWIANSWLGEHRNSASHLFQVIREKRGLNYGDYSYIECFPDGGSRQMPPVNVPRRHQLFEIWIRTVPVDQAPFALKAAIRELRALCAHGLDKADFELTRSFLKKYSAHFAPASSERLGYAVDDRFYAFADPSLADEGHLARFRRKMDELTVDDVNRAIRLHWQDQPLTIAVVTGNAAALITRLTQEAPTPIKYESEMPVDILAEDVSIAAVALRIDAHAVTTIALEDTFAR